MKDETLGTSLQFMQEEQGKMKLENDVSIKYRKC